MTTVFSHLSETASSGRVWKEAISETDDFPERQYFENTIADLRILVAELLLDNEKLRSEVRRPQFRLGSAASARVSQ